MTGLAGAVDVAGVAAGNTAVGHGHTGRLEQDREYLRKNVRLQNQRKKKPTRQPKINLIPSISGG